MSNRTGGEQISADQSEPEPAYLLPGAISRRISSARGPAVAARAGIVLGIAVTVCFLTGLISHWIQHPPGWFAWPAHPVWLYRVTQGAHVITGVVAIPLLLVKLWSVYPRLFARPLLGNPFHLLERGSIALLVGSVIFQLFTGLLNIAQVYPWKFFFTTTHYAVAYLAAGALAVHLAVKLPVVRSALSRRCDEAETSERAGASRRTVLFAGGAAALVAGLSVAGQTVPFLRGLAVLAPRSGEGPQGVPVNRTAAAAGVAGRATAADYALTVTAGDRTRAFTRADLESLPQHAADLPIACVEGWSASARWSGVRLRDLLAAVGEYRGGAVRFSSLEGGGIYRTSTLPHTHVIAADTLIALRLNGADLNLDHGYPCRLIAPNRPGVLQTKWLSTIEELP
ncbi:molybdopterin-dependent oxidoreductase [Nocardia huaxiensis]|uniref:Molybdopterin-dependent oxidoreductase n=1 Tax=Nocardia huaxiensis TaxID=2755382 RepID=A0A7D6VEX1_9NOCA|nr:molybdopterin-dependent oxidoreductase [Nocardia huaxiensis]QLY33874.1 molybdopterin-dependent oxidoreductase [Nocardia huaxiensis]UFS99195.1 molybdopterin-dependent oxidoreductase [Nocardia huaxiensis]